MKKRALVIGAGIAGPVLGVGLARAGFEARVVEAYSERELAGAGTWLTVAVNGLAALRTFGLHQRVIDVGFPARDIELANGRGRTLGVAPLGGVLPDGTATQNVRRADLHRVLLEGARREGVSFTFGERLAQAEPRRDRRVLARFESGRELEADVLIGADGVHSRVRTIIDASAPEPREVGMGNVGGFAPRSESLGLAPGIYRMIFGDRAFFGYVVHPSGEVWWFANPPTPVPEGAGRAWLAELFEHDEGPAAQLVRATPGRLVFSRQYELPRVPRWTRDAMVIVGDAAHAASPTSGQGASLAIEDAVALSRCLRDLPVAEALHSFELQRRARAERVVAEAARASTHKLPGPFGRFLRDRMLPIVLSVATRANRDWLFTYEIPWDQPVTTH
ncbi:MAG: FAD-dependent monooxygenase [Myxococcales bacterium]|nr:FAD-dependent monooxygenase [Myxococcales bacterium]